MKTEDVGVYADLKKLERQLHAAVTSIEAEMPMSCVFPIKTNEPNKINKGYEIGDFVITPRFPKTDFQG